MKLTAYTNYALRTLQLAALKAPDLVRIEDVVQIHGLKKPSIVKAVHELGREGYLDTLRGRGAASGSPVLRQKFASATSCV